jgi:hypothetical protein
MWQEVTLHFLHLNEVWGSPRSQVSLESAVVVVSQKQSELNLEILVVVVWLIQAEMFAYRLEV